MIITSSYNVTSLRDPRVGHSQLAKGTYFDSSHEGKDYSRKVLWLTTQADRSRGVTALVGMSIHIPMWQQTMKLQSNLPEWTLREADTLLRADKVLVTD